jgi:hypothetical protein
MATYILKVLKLPPKTKIKDLNITQLAVDVTEQPIERPILNQKKYFSGKKKTHNEDFIICLLAN